MGHFQGPTPGLERKSDPSSFGDLPEVEASVDVIDLVLEISWANECVALAVQVVSRHRGHLL